MRSVNDITMIDCSSEEERQICSVLPTSNWMYRRETDTERRGRRRGQGGKGGRQAEEGEMERETGRGRRERKGERAGREILKITIRWLRQ